MAILKANRDQTDYDYIEEWMARLGLSSLWKEVLASSS